jgi:hypothetical protein
VSDATKATKVGEGERAGGESEGKGGKGDMGGSNTSSLPPPVAVLTATILTPLQLPYEVSRPAYVEDLEVGLVPLNITVDGHLLDRVLSLVTPLAEALALPALPVAPPVYDANADNCEEEEEEDEDEEEEEEEEDEDEDEEENDEGRESHAGTRDDFTVSPFTASPRVVESSAALLEAIAPDLVDALYTEILTRVYVRRLLVSDIDVRVTIRANLQKFHIRTGLFVATNRTPLKFATVRMC